jgi:hypothetical protein
MSNCVNELCEWSCTRYRGNIIFLTGSKFLQLQYCLIFVSSFLCVTKETTLFFQRNTWKCIWLPLIHVAMKYQHIERVNLGRSQRHDVVTCTEQLTKSERQCQSAVKWYFLCWVFSLAKFWVWVNYYLFVCGYWLVFLVWFFLNVGGAMCKWMVHWNAWTMKTRILL